MTKRCLGSRGSVKGVQRGMVKGDLGYIWGMGKV